MRTQFLLTVLAFALLSPASASKPTPPAPAAQPEVPVVTAESVNAEARAFVGAHEAKVAPLYKAMNLASWQATIEGTDAAFAESARLELELRQAHSDPASFAKLKAWKGSALITDPVLKRQIELLYNAFAANQMDPVLMKRIVDLGNEVSQLFSTYRGQVDGKDMSTNDVAEVLKSERKVARRKAAWEASKDVGKVVGAKVVELVKLRNEAARKMGYADYYDMQMRLSELDPATVKQLFDDLVVQTETPFTTMKAELDGVIAKRFKTEVADLRPWHYDDLYFQEAPRLTKVDFDAFYKGKDIVKITGDYYAGLGLPLAQEVLKVSDLFEKPGKQPAAYCNDMDRKGDVRIFANVKDDEYWMGTMLHETGHAVYARYTDMNPDLPFTLKDAAQAFTTEAIAEMFGRYSMDPDWINRVVGVSKRKTHKIAADARKTSRSRVLIFARWSAVMVNFERSMYQDPDQDLNTLWWDLVEKYQKVHRPDGRNSPDWAAKIHIVTAPVYYHNYIMGEMMASQVLASIAKAEGRTDGKADLVARPEAGQWLVEHIFKPGTLYPWNELITRATGEPLTPKYFADEWVMQ